MISILLVDDEAQFLEVTRMFLEKGRGIRVTTATSGDEAIGILHDRKFDAIISDYAMPGMNGIEFMKQVKAMGDDTPFIIFTGKGREDVVIDALNFGADLYLEKGPDPRAQFSDMMQKVRNMVSLRTDIRGERETIRVLTSIMKRFPGMFFRLSLEGGGTLLYASPGAELLTGFTPGNFLDGTVDFHTLILPGDLEAVREARSAALASEDEYRICYRIVSRSGIEKRVKETGHFVPGASESLLEGYILDLDCI